MLAKLKHRFGAGIPSRLRAMALSFRRQCLSQMVVQLKALKEEYAQASLMDQQYNRHLAYNKVQYLAFSYSKEINYDFILHLIMSLRQAQREFLQMQAEQHDLRIHRQLDFKYIIHAYADRQRNMFVSSLLSFTTQSGQYHVVRSSRRIVKIQFLQQKQRVFQVMRVLKVERIMHLAFHRHQVTMDQLKKDALEKIKKNNSTLKYTQDRKKEKQLIETNINRFIYNLFHKYQDYRKYNLIQEVSLVLFRVRQQLARLRHRVRQKVKAMADRLILKQNLRTIKETQEVMAKAAVLKAQQNQVKQENKALQQDLAGQCIQKILIKYWRYYKYNQVTVLRVCLESLSLQKNQQRQALVNLSLRLYLYEFYKLIKALKRRILLYKDFQHFTLRLMRYHKKGLLQSLRDTRPTMLQTQARNKIRQMIKDDLENRRRAFILLFQKKVFKLNSFRIVKQRKMILAKSKYMIQTYHYQSKQSLLKNLFGLQKHMAILRLMVKMHTLFQRSQNYKSYLYFKSFLRLYLAKLQRQRFRAFVFTIHYKLRQGFLINLKYVLSKLAAHLKRHYVIHLKYIRLATRLSNIRSRILIFRMAQKQAYFIRIKDKWVILATAFRKKSNLNKMRSFIVIKKVQTKIFVQMVDNCMAFEKYKIDIGIKGLKELFMNRREIKRFQGVVTAYRPCAKRILLQNILQILRSQEDVMLMKEAVWHFYYIVQQVKLFQFKKIKRRLRTVHLRIRDQKKLRQMINLYYFNFKIAYLEAMNLMAYEKQYQINARIQVQQMVHRWLALIYYIRLMINNRKFINKVLILKGQQQKMNELVHKAAKKHHQYTIASLIQSLNNHKQDLTADKYRRLYLGMCVKLNGLFKLVFPALLQEQLKVRKARNKIQGLEPKLMDHIRKGLIKFFRSVQRNDTLQDYIVQQEMNQLVFLQYYRFRIKAFIRDLKGIEVILVYYRKRMYFFRKITYPYVDKVKREHLDNLVDMIKMLRSRYRFRQLCLALLHHLEDQKIIWFKVNIHTLISTKKNALKKSFSTFSYFLMNCGKVNLRFTEQEKVEQPIMKSILEELQDITCIEVLFLAVETPDYKINPIKFKKILMYFLKSFLLNFWSLSSLQIDFANRTFTKYRLKFLQMYIEQLKTENVIKRVNYFFIIFIYQVFAREFSYIHKNIKRLEEMILELPKEEDREFYGNTLLLWQFWLQVLFKSNFKVAPQFSGVRLVVDKGWVEKLRHIKSIKGVFNNFMLRLILLLWEYLNPEEHEQHYEEIKTIEFKYEGQYKVIVEKAQSILINSVDLIFNPLSKKQGVMVEEMRETKSAFFYPQLRLLYYYNKHIHPNKNSNLILCDLLERLNQGDEKEDLEFALVMKIKGKNLEVNIYEQLYETQQQNYQILYQAQRLQLKYIEVYSKSALIIDKTLNFLLKRLDHKTHLKPLALCFYSYINYYRAYYLHRRPLLIMPQMIRIFQIYHMAYVHKIAAMVSYSQDIHKALDIVRKKIDLVLSNPKRDYSMKKKQSYSFFKSRPFFEKFLKTFDPFAHDLMVLIENLPANKYDYQNFADLYPDRFESFWFLWYFNQRNYFTIDKSWKFLYEYQRNLRSNHPFLIYSQIKDKFSQFEIIMQFYIGLSPYQCLQVIGKEYYAESDSVDVIELQRILHYKSLLRIHALKAIQYVFTEYEVHNQMILGYFSAKSFIKFYEVQKEDQFNTDKRPELLQNLELTFVKEITAERVIINLQKTLGITDNMFLKAKTHFLIGKAEWLLNKDYGASRFQIQKCSDIIAELTKVDKKYGGYCLQDKRLKYFEAIKK